MRVRKKASMERGKSGSPSRCADILQKTLRGLGLGRTIHHLAVLGAWDRAIPPRVRTRAAVEDFRDGRLYLRVDDPIWLHELHMLRHKLKMILNEELGEPIVSEIVSRIGRTAPSVTRNRPRPPMVKERTVPTGAEVRVQQLLTPLKDQPCRDALERLLYRWMVRSI